VEADIEPKQQQELGSYQLFIPVCPYSRLLRPSGRFKRGDPADRFHVAFEVGSYLLRGGGVSLQAAP
jgi:hypothetical protein